MARTKKEAALTPEERLQAALVPDWEWPYKLPENWCWTNWGKCGKFIAGSGFKNEYQGFTNYDIPFYKVSSLKIANETGYLYDYTNTIDEAVRKKLKAVLIPTNSLLFAKIGEAIRLNRRAINTVPCCIDNNMMAFVPFNARSAQFIYYVFQNMKLGKLAEATALPSLSGKKICSVERRFPQTIEEQVSIATVLADMDSEIDVLSKKLNKYRMIKAGMMNELLTGRIRLL